MIKGVKLSNRSRETFGLLLLAMAAVFAFATPKAMAEAGTAIPGGGYLWYDQYAEAFLDTDRGTVVARFDPVGQRTNNDAFAFEFSGSVDSACGLGGSDWVYFKSTLVPCEFDAADTTADGQFVGSAQSDTCGVHQFFVIKASLTNITPYQVQQEPPGNCPVLTGAVNGCYYLTRNAHTPIGATALVKFWWCGAHEPTEPADCKDPFRLGAVARQGQVKMGKEVVVTKSAPLPSVCPSSGAASVGTDPPPIVQCLAETVLPSIGPIAVPDPRDCVAIEPTAREADVIPDCLED